MFLMSRPLEQREVNRIGQQSNELLHFEACCIEYCLVNATAVCFDVCGEETRQGGPVAIFEII